MGLDAEHRPLVTLRLVTLSQEPAAHPDVGPARCCCKETDMGRGILLWLLGVPIPVIILLWLFLR
jgi:hypothetical protein